MKKIALLMVFCLVLFSSIAYAKQYNDSWGDHGFSILRQNSSDLSLNFSIQEYFTTDTEVDGETLQTIHIPGVFLPNNEGAPDLPGMSRYIAIPEGASVTFEIVDYRTEVVPSMDIAPAPRIPLDTEDGPLDYHKDLQIYSKDEFYPAQPVVISDVRQIRGVDVVIVGITPFQYNPITKEMVVYRDLQIDLKFNGGNGQYGEDRLRSRWWDPIYAQSILNYDVIPEKDYSNTSSKDNGCEYLIIIPDHPDFITWADTVKSFRQKQGIVTKVVTLSDIGSNSTSALENYFNTAYNTWDPAPSAVLLLADYGTEGPTGTSIISPSFGSCVSDNVYADVDGDDLPDIHFARITARNYSELEVTISKFLDNETDPPTNPDFYDHPVTALGWQTERWFQICSETVGGFWSNILGKNQVRINAIYSGNPNGGVWSTATNTATVLAYFGPAGLGYIPTDPSTLGGWTGGNATMVNNAINSGAFMLQHRDHGGTSGWGEPDYGNSDLGGLYNDDLVYVFSINCLTGKFNNSSECFAEAMHRYEHRALGIIAASETSYSFVNDTYVWGMYDLMWPQFMPDYGASPTNSDWIYPCMGNSAGKIFLEGSSWPYNTSNKQITYYLFHHHGDAFLTVYSEIPQNLAVTHDAAMLSGMTTFNVSANLGAEIALSVDDEIIGTGIGMGLSPTPISIESQLPGVNVLVTVVKQNYYRYEQIVNVIPPSGPYIIYESHSINDAGANDNGVIDYGEDILLGLTLKNVGVQAADNVIATLSTADDCINFTDNSENFGTIGADQSSTMTDAYEFTVSNSVEDQHYVLLDVSVEGDPGVKETWDTSFGIVINAPHFVVGSLSINDSGGNNNGRLDPGETVTITVEATNDGHAMSPDATGTLVSNNGYVDITTGTYDFGTFNVNQPKTALFELTVDNDAPTGASIPLEFNVTGGNYSATEMFYEYIGLSIEDFETGDFSAYNWVMGGDADWTIDETNAYEGNYCARSGAIGNNSETELSLTIDTNAGDISFFRRVSSENNYDYLEFYIDGALQGEWAGEASWGEVSYPVSAGTHTFKWVYDKDYTQTGGQDCAWIDYITFPPVLSPFPVFYLSPGSLDFGQVEVGHDSTRQFTIYNLGSGTLTGYISTPTCYSVAETGTTPRRNQLDYSIGMGGSQTYDLTFLPQNAQNYDGEVMIQINPFSFDILEVFGTGVPEIGVDDNTFFERTEILGSFPNPAKGSAVIQYHLKGSILNQNAEIKIYNIHGEYVKTVNGTSGKAYIDTSDMATGIYFYKLVNQNLDEVKKMILVK
ncbi:MAG: T9SS type A sorting domain-containing protein [Candidatus Cloacimonetes bacterium]|nr:T9SS type A sorting domain-containing protein [Candidatus Cloacimonadota bacterium]